MDKVHDIDNAEVTLFNNAQQMTADAIKKMFQSMVDTRPYGGTSIGFGAVLKVDGDRKQG